MKLSNLANVLRAAGLTVVETPGWASRGYAGQDLAEVRGVLWHHTATASARFALAGAPTLQMTINGRSDLAGPLCNITFGRDGTVYLVAAGVANHAGAGSAPGVPTNAGNHYLIGIEMESSGVTPWDWTADQIRVAPHLGAALERAYLRGTPADMRLQLGHKEYSSQGKIDPAGWPGDMDGLRASINAVLNGSAAIATEGATTKPKGFLMALTDAQQDELYTKITRYLDAPVGSVPEKVWAQTVTRGGQQVSVKQELADAKSEAQALRALVGALSKNPDLTAEQISAAVKAGLADGVTVDVNVNGGK